MLIFAGFLAGIASTLVVAMVTMFIIKIMTSKKPQPQWFVTIADLPLGCPFTVVQCLEKWPGYVIGKFFGGYDIFLLKLPENFSPPLRADDLLVVYMKNGQLILKLRGLGQESFMT